MGRDINVEPQKQKTLMMARVIWMALLAGPLMFLALVLAMLGMREQTIPTESPLEMVFTVSALAMLVGSVVGGYVFRSQTYKRGWECNAVKPGAYFTGNLILWALCEGTAFFSLVALFTTEKYWPFAVIAAVALGVQVINFPTGRAMEPDEMAYHDRLES